MSTMVLVERDQEIKLLEGLLTDKGTGRPAVAIIGGATGMGKSALLHAFRKRVVAAGAAVLDVSSPPEELDRPYSTVLGLLDSAARLAAAAGPGHLSSLSNEVRTDSTPAVDELFRAVSRLSERGPVLVAVDDVENTDPASLRCLARLARHRTENPIAIVLTWDRKLGQRSHPALEELLYQPNVRRVNIGPLSRGGVGRMIAESFPNSPDQHLVQSCCERSGGNPYLLHAILADLNESPTELFPTTLRGAPVDIPGNGKVVRDAIVTCLHRLGPAAVTIARGVALLDEYADIHLLSRLGNIGPVLTGHVLRKLAEIGILRDIRFRHEAARAAVLDDIPPREAVE